MTLEVVLNSRNELAEIPIWCERTQRLFWTDIRANKIHTLTPEAEAVETFEMPDWVGAFALCEDGNLIVASRNSILAYDLIRLSYLSR